MQTFGLTQQVTTAWEVPPTPHHSCLLQLGACGPHHKHASGLFISNFTAWVWGQSKAGSTRNSVSILPVSQGKSRFYSELRSCVTFFSSRVPTSVANCRCVGPHGV